MGQMKITVLPAKKKVTNLKAPDDVKKIRVAAYCRVSTDNEEQESSYEVQVKHFTNYINNRNDWELAGIYADDGISGTNTKKREQFNKMVQDATDGKIDMIITKSISRFARNTVDCLNTIRKLKANNVPVYFEKENINTMDSSGELLLTIMSSIAQQESVSLSKNVRIGVQYRFQQGQVYVNYNRFLGYTRNDEGKLVIVPEEAEVVKRIYREYLAGGTTNSIAAGLEQDGILNGAKNKKWYGTNIEQILKNEKYIGDAILQKTYTVDILEKKRSVNHGELPQYYVEDSHEAIISDQIFMEVQAEIARRAELGKESNGRRRYTFKNALSSVLICGSCGNPYRRLTWKPHGKLLYRWKCRTRVEKGLKACDGRILHEDVIQNAVVQAIKQTICNPDEEYEKLQNDILTEISDGNAKELKQIEDELEELQQQVVKKVNDNDEFNNLVERIQELRDRKVKLTQQQALNDGNLDRIKKLRDKLKSEKEDALAYDDQLVRDFIEKIEVFPDKLVFTMKAGMKTEVEI